MEKNNFTQEIALAVVLIVLLVALLEPFGLFMTPMVLMSLSVILFIVVALFAALIWREHALDEREALHRSASDRAAFLAGSLFLAGIIVYQVSNHTLNGALIAALALMVGVKIAARIYNRLKH